MKVRFEYNCCIEFIFKTHSDLSISGKGEWNVDEIDLAEEYCDRDDCIESIDFIKNYFYIELDKDPDNFIFNSDDIKSLCEFLENYKADNYYNEN